MPALTPTLRGAIVAALPDLSRTYQQIADDLGCSVRLVARIAAEEELQRPRGRRADPALVERARALEGLTQTAIGVELRPDRPLKRLQVQRLLRRGKQG